MTWAKIDDRWPKDKRGKAVAAGPLGRDLYVCGLCHCTANLTDGFIPETLITSLAPGNPRPRQTAMRLVEVGLWEDVSGGWRVHDYLDYNPSAETIRAQRDETKDRVSRWRVKRGGNASRNDDVTRSVTPPLSSPLLTPIRPPVADGVTASSRSTSQCPNSGRLGPHPAHQGSVVIPDSGVPCYPTAEQRALWLHVQDGCPRTEHLERFPPDLRRQCAEHQAPRP